jgi:DNA-binding NtrC family response regulator
VGIPKTAQGQSVEMARKILVVYDEPDICFVLEKTLGQNGFMIDTTILC